MIQEPECRPDDDARNLAFLKELGLDRHIRSPTVGPGFSFSCSITLSLGSQTHRRSELVEPRDARAAFIEKLVSGYPKVFSADERAAIVTTMHCELTRHPVRARFNP